MPIVAQLTKHCKTLLNHKALVKHHETHISHTESCVFSSLATMPIVARLAKHHETLKKTSWNTCTTSINTCKTLWTTSKTSWNTRKTLWNTWTLADRCDNIGARCGNIGIQCSHIGARRGVPGYISNCSVGITLQMYNRVTNPWDMGIFSKPGAVLGQLCRCVTKLSPSYESVWYGYILQTGPN